MTATKLSCAFAVLCIAAIAASFWHIATTPDVQHPTAVLLLGLAGIGTFVSLVILTSAQIIRIR
jgi:hypothetical protein